jgi:hypothetical protein
LFVHCFPQTDLEIEYLLKEDEDSVAFTAFSTYVREKRFVRSGEHKSFYSEAKFGPRIADDEMRFRIRDFMREAALLIMDVSDRSCYLTQC